MITQIKKNWQLVAILIIIFSFPTFPLKAEVTEIMPHGTIEGQGTYFDITNSEYLNIFLQSSEPVKIRMESIPKMITIMIESISSAKSAEISLSGFAPLTTYYKYQDDYHNLKEFTTDENGSYAYTQDLSEPHLVFIQLRKSTKFIKDDSTGGDCTSIGIWDSITKTCTLTQDVVETIQIDANNITMDGAGFLITGSGTGNGVFVTGRRNVTIENITIKSFSNGIYLNNTDGIIVRGNNANDGSVGIRLFPASNTLLENNTTKRNSNFGVYVILNSPNLTMRGNVMSDNRENLYLRTFPFGAFGHDIDTTNTTDGKPVYYIENKNGREFNNLGEVGVFFCIFCQNMVFRDFSIDAPNETALYLWDTDDSVIENIRVADNDFGVRFEHSDRNTVSGSTFEHNLAGVLLRNGSANNIFFHNNFIDNYFSHVAINSAGANIFNLPVPDGGNYWDTFDESSEGCDDTDSDGFCDSPYVFSGGQDNYPWTKQDGWLEEKSLPAKAALLAKELISYSYLWGGKGWDYYQDLFVSPDVIKTGYNFYNPSIKTIDSGVGVDCSGLVMWAYDKSFDPLKSPINNFVKYEGANGQYLHNTTQVAESELQPGDVMFFDWNSDNHIDHVAMYVGENEGYDVVNARSRELGIRGMSKNILKELPGFVSFKQVISALPPAILATTHSPVDLIVTDPDGFTITPTTIISSDVEYLHEIPGVLYYSEMGKGEDGNPIDQVYSPILKIGDYTIKIVPILGTSPGVTYSLIFSAGDKTVNLAQDMPISQIPTNGYGVTVSETGAINSFIPVEIDVRQDSINLKSNGVTPVVIFGSATFDVKQIDPTTIKLASADIKLKNNGQLMISYENINEDGFIDFVFYVTTKELNLTLNATKADLEGRLITEEIIKGSDSVRIVPKL